MKLYSIALITLAFLLTSCDGSEEPAPHVDDMLSDPMTGVDAPSNSVVTSQGMFTSFAHSLSGDAELYTDASGARTLRFKNFNMTQGPDVYVLFSKTNNYSKANTVAVSMLKGEYSNTSLNFDVDKAIDLSTHKFVLVYCVQFSSLFGYAELK